MSLVENVIIPQNQGTIAQLIHEKISLGDLTQFLELKKLLDPQKESTQESWQKERECLGISPGDEYRLRDKVSQLFPFPNNVVIELPLYEFICEKKNVIRRSHLDLREEKPQEFNYTQYLYKK